MWWWKCVCCAIFLSLHLASGEYSCYMGGKNLSCTALTKDNLHENITVLLGNENSNTIEELSISDSSLFTIKRAMFTNFKNLQRLSLQSSKINYLDGDAFADLTNLQKLYLTDNYLGRISSSILPVNNTLQTLDLSQNLLIDLSEFDITAFPALTILNISHNKLEYLPENIVNKLKEESKFYLIIDNNPWNCDHVDWNQHLTPILTDAFCTSNAYDPRAAEKKLEMLAAGYLVQESDERLETRPKCAWNHCLLWMFGAAWVGIILGNVCQIKRLLFTTPTRYDDKTTQCDKLDLMAKV